MEFEMNVFSLLVLVLGILLDFPKKTHLFQLGCNMYLICWGIPRVVLQYMIYELNGYVQLWRDRVYKSESFGVEI